MLSYVLYLYYIQGEKKLMQKTQASWNLKIKTI